MLPRLFVLPLLLSSLLCIAYAEVVNKEVVRVIDGSASIVRTSIDIKVEGITNDAYELVFPNAQAAALAYLSVSSQGVELEVQPPVMYGTTVYSIYLPTSCLKPH